MSEALDAARAEMAAQNWLAAYDLAMDAIEAGDDDPLLCDLVVRALVNMGSSKRALTLYDALEIAAPARLATLSRKGKIDALTLKGRILKERGRVGAPERRQLRFLQAADVYQRVFDEFGDYFPAINVATTALLGGDRARAEAMARIVLADPAVAEGSGYFEYASGLEACLVLRDEACARGWLERMLACADIDPNMRRSTAAQLQLLRSALPDCARLIDKARAALGNPPVVAYSGHMFAQGDPLEAALARKVAASVKALKPAAAFGALACGADIVVAEAMLAAGVSLHVVLPFATRDFVRESVVNGGESWRARFHACMKQARSVSIVSDSKYVGDPEQFSFGTDIAHGLALIRAQPNHAEAIQLAVLQRGAARQSAGTARDFEQWASLGHRTITIDPGAIDRNVRRKVLTTPSNRVRKSILFADFKGFSQLSEAQLPIFVKKILGVAADVLGKHDASVRVRNSWGDAVYAVIDDPVAAAEIALEIQERLRELPKGIARKGFDAGMRIAIHHGPVYRDIDPVLAKRTYFGSAVTLTARIEPVTPVGEVFTTLPFAAMLALQAPDRFALDYVGRVKLAKNYGLMGMFRLSAANEE